MPRSLLKKIARGRAKLRSSVKTVELPDFSEIAAIVREAPLLSGAVAGAGLTLLFGSVGMFDDYYLPGRFVLHDTTSLRVGSVAVSAIAGFGLGWLLSPRAGRLRSFLLGGAAGIALIATIADHGPIGWGTATILSLAGFMGGMGYWARKMVRRLIERPTTFGTAAWATIHDLLTGGLLSGKGFRLGFTLDDMPLSYAGDRHMLTVAPNRSGKGTSVIIPNLLTWEGSVMVIDPKGENAMITAGQRRAMGQKVHVIDPWGITGLDVSRINPLNWLAAGDVDIGDNAILLADAIVVVSGNERFWDEEAKAILVGVLIFVATDPAEKGQRHLGRVRDLLLLDGDDLRRLFQRMLDSPHHIVASTGARCLQKDEKLLSNVLASVQAQTHFLDSPRLRDSLSHSDFSFEELKAEPTSIYLVLPTDRLNSHGRWLRLLIQQALTMNARNIEQKPDKSVLFILDEMPALGRLTMVEQAFGLMAGYGMQIHGVVQDASQLKRIYGDGWETFISNAGVIQYFGSRDRMTAEYFSALCGTTTVWNFSSAVGRVFGSSSGQGGSSSSTSNSDTTAAAQRKLAYADELMRLPEDRQLLLVENLNPIIGRKQPWFEDEELRSLGRNLQDPA